MEYSELNGFVAPSHPVIVHQSKKSLEPTLVDPGKCIQEIRALIPTRPDVAFYRSDSEFLHRFLKSRKYRINESFAVLCKYFQFRHQHRDLCVGLSTSAPGVQSAILDGVVGVLPEKDICGRPILVIIAANWEYSRYDTKTIYQAVLVTLEYLVEKPAVQDTGIVAIIDWTDFPARHATSLTPKSIRMFLDGIQEAFPLRLGALHVVSPPWYVDAAIVLSKPFLKDKLKERVTVHGNNLHTLHSSIPARLLPAELGGEGGEYNALVFASQILALNKTDSKLPKKPNLATTGKFSASFDSSMLPQRTHVPADSSSLSTSLLKIF